MIYLKETNISAYKQLDTKLNNKSNKQLDMLLANSKEVVYWRCTEDKNHIWATPVYERANPKTDNGCLICKSQNYNSNHVRLIQSKRIKMEKYDKIEHRFHCFICNHTWNKISSDTPVYYDMCVNCYSGIHIPDFSFTYHEYVEEWDKEGNILDINQVNEEYPFEIKWKCKKCNQLWESTIDERYTNLKNCPYCSGKLPFPDKTSLAALYPELLKEYLSMEEHDPYKIYPDSKLWARWRCTICHLPYSAKINDKTSGNALCPNCNSKKPIQSSIYESIISEFDADSMELNIPIEQLHDSYKVDLSWKCKECNNIWRGSLYSRLYENKECPYCTGQKVLPGKTSFKALYPELMKEWNVLSNTLLIDPDMILDTYSKVVWWNCSDCKYKYPMSPAKRSLYKIRNQIACPKCKGIRHKKSHFI